MTVKLVELVQEFEPKHLDENSIFVLQCELNVNKSIGFFLRMPRQTDNFHMDMLL